jgi:hypothetical protein
MTKKFSDNPEECTSENCTWCLTRKEDGKDYPCNYHKGFAAGQKAPRGEFPAIRHNTEQEANRIRAECRKQTLKELKKDIKKECKECCEHTLPLINKKLAEGGKE